MNRGFPPPSRPLRVSGGVRARSRRGTIAQTWWSQRFVEVLESIGLGNRLERGRRYARAGQVLELRFDAGTVTASVQGSRRAPYRVRLGLTVFGKAQWAAVTELLAADAWYAAALLSGEMPHEIEAPFAAVGLALFPSRPGDLSMDCSCPDREVPCKHVAAVLYLVAEALDSDPFAILAWRGRERDELLAALDDLRADDGRDPERAERLRGSEPLAACLDHYWVGGTVTPQRPTAQGGDALLEELPRIEVTVRGLGLAAALRPAYRELAAARAGED